MPTREGGDVPRWASSDDFDGWVSLSHIVRAVDVRIDFCPECKHIYFDLFVSRGLDWSKGRGETKYLDAAGHVVESPEVLLGRPMCVWRAEGKIGVRPCRRARGHDGECALFSGDESVCSVCRGDETDERYPALVYTTRALEHHAVTAHDIERREDGWYVRPYGFQVGNSGIFRPGQGGPYVSALLALRGLAS